MQTLEVLLAKHPFFTGLEPPYIRLIARFASYSHYESHTYLFHEGGHAAHFYIIQEGKVALETFAAERGMMTIETIETGEVLGWSWLFPPYRWHFGARVVEPTSAIVLDGVSLRARCEEDHHFGYELTKRVAAEKIFLSMERNMKCAIGFCRRCQYSHSFVCRDGPIFSYGSIQDLLVKREM